MFARLMAAAKSRDARRIPCHKRPGRAKTVRAGRLLERRVEVFANQPGRRRGARGADPIGLEDDHLDAGRGEARRARASGQAAADDDDIGVQLPPQARVGGTTSLGEAVQPEGSVTGHRFWWLFYPARSPSRSFRFLATPQW